MNGDQTGLKSREARLSAAGVDARRAEMLQDLATALAEARSEDRSQSEMSRNASDFVEAYFTNFIEGVEFLPAQALELVEAHGRPTPEAGDLLSSYEMLTDASGLRELPSDYAEFERVLKLRHRRLMAMRPEKRPGEFKVGRNRAGDTVFVAPDKVVPTLKHGWNLLSRLKDPFARGLFVHCLISEVHPFDDGNGRMARMAMSAELSNAEQAHVVVPTVFRDDYIGGLRVLTKRGDPSPIIRAMRRLHDLNWTISKDAPTPKLAIEAWARVNAFMRPGVNARLEAYDPATGIEWRDGMPAPKAYWEAEDRPEEALPSLSR
jgi:hypothetical protein